MVFRQGFNSQRRELTAISTHLSSISSGGVSTCKISTRTRAINSLESSDTTSEDLEIARPGTYQPFYRVSRARGCNLNRWKLKLSSLFLDSVWEFSVYKANQGWEFSLRPYSIRPFDSQFFDAIRNADLPLVREMLHGGKASIWDRDSCGWGVLHYAAFGCRENGSLVVEFLINSGADIYCVDDLGLPPYFEFENTFNKINENEQDALHLVSGYKAFMSHPDWVSPHPSIRVPNGRLRDIYEAIDLFPVFKNPPEEIVRTILYEMWPPWKDMSPADRMNTLFAEFDGNWLSGKVIKPCIIRACLSREYIRETFASWDIRDKIKLMKHVVDQLAKQLALSSENGIKEARFFLKDMQIADSFVTLLPEVDPLGLFLANYACLHLVIPKLRVEKHIKTAQKALKLYVAEMMLLGIDIPVLADIERKVRAILEEEGGSREIWISGLPLRLIAVEFGDKAEDSHLWLSNPRDEWAGEFWDMIDHPERAIPGAWTEEWESYEMDWLSN